MRRFALAWASDWNTWAAAHKVPERIITVGCNYLSHERYRVTGQAAIRTPAR